jgi:hypothetical protein
VDRHIYAYARCPLCLKAGTLTLGVAFTDQDRSPRSQCFTRRGKGFRRMLLDEVSAGTTLVKASRQILTFLGRSTSTGLCHSCSTAHKQSDLVHFLHFTSSARENIYTAGLNRILLHSFIHYLHFLTVSAALLVHSTIITPCTKQKSKDAFPYACFAPSSPHLNLTSSSSFRS